MQVVWRGGGVERYEYWRPCDSMDNIVRRNCMSWRWAGTVLYYGLGLFEEIERVPFLHNHLPDSLCSSYSFKL
jgi:hypothetical protein